MHLLLPVFHVLFIIALTLWVVFKVGEAVSPPPSKTVNVIVAVVAAVLVPLIALLADHS